MSTLPSGGPGQGKHANKPTYTAPVTSLGHSRCANTHAHVVTLYVALQGHCRTLSVLPCGRAGHTLLANSHSHDAMRWPWDTSGAQTRMPISLGNSAGKVLGGSAETQQAHIHVPI